MANPKTIKKAFERTTKAFKEKPSVAQKTGRVKARSEEGLACNIEAGPFNFKTDMPKPIGGDESAPTPGMYEAAALGSCVTIMAKMWGAKLDVPIDSIEAEVEYDVDKRFLFDLGEVPSRWSTIRYHITVESTASEKDVMRVLDKAHQQSHVRGDYEHMHQIERSVTINEAIAKT